MTKVSGSIVLVYGELPTILRNVDPERIVGGEGCQVTGCAVGKGRGGDEGRVGKVATSSNDREVGIETRERERAGRREGKPGDEHCALYIYPGREHCALNWGDVDEGTLLSLGAEGVIPGRYIVSLLRVFKQFTHTLPSR